MENNQAFIAKIGNIQPIEGADKIVKASILLDGIPVTNVVVGVDTQEGQEVVYFDSNMCLVKSTILTDYPELERYLGKNGRVKTIKLKGTYSDGLAVDVEKFYRYFKDEEQAKEWLTHGKNFNEIGDVKISYKYEPPRKEVKGQNKKGVKGKKISRLIEGQFHFHIDTDQLPRNIHDLNPDDVISISRKIHGCVSEDTCVDTLEKGELTIGEIVKNKLDVNIKAYNTLSHEVVYVPIDDYYFKPDDGDWLEIELENGTKLEITSNNPVWLPELMCYRKASDLKIGDLLLYDN